MLGEDQQIVYEGCIDIGYFDSDSIRGEARLRKYDLRTHEIVENNDGHPERKLIWELRSPDNQYLLYPLSPGVWSVRYHYALEADAERKGITVDPESYKRIFDELDQKLKLFSGLLDYSGYSFRREYRLLNTRPLTYPAFEIGGIIPAHRTWKEVLTELWHL